MKGTLVIITAILLLVLSFLFFTNITIFNKGYSKAKAYLGDGVGPVLKTMSAPVRSVDGFFEGYVNLINVKKRNIDLRNKLDKLQFENEKMVELEKENQRLKALLRLSEQKPNEYIAAHVTGEDVMNWFRCIIIDKGRGAGIKEKSPVITPAGLVGQAVEISKWHSKVMILNDTNSAVDTYITGKHTRGIVEGTGKTIVKLKYVLKNDDMEVGDRLITSGKDGVYPKDLPVGIIININKNMPGLFADIDVMPFNNFKKLDEVLVMKR